MNDDEKLAAIQAIIDELGDPDFWTYGALDEAVNRIQDVLDGQAIRE